MLKALLVLITVLFAGPGIANAACAFENDVPVKSLFPDFAAWRAVAEAARECGKVEAELSSEYRERQPDAFAASPARFNIAGVNNASVVPLLNGGTVRELDDLVEKHGAPLTPNQLIRVDGRIVAVAMIVNAQHLMVRKDILDELDIEVPTTWDEVLEATDAVRASGKMDHPLGVTMKPGWDRAQEWVNLFLGAGGQFVNNENQPTLAGDAGRKALETLKRIADAVGPDRLEDDAAAVQKRLSQGEIAIAQLWASHAGALNDPKESKVVDLVQMSAAPALEEGGRPATTIWWDGIVLAKNQSDADADAAFRVALEGMDAEMVSENRDAAVWLISGYRPGAFAQGVAQSAAAGAPAYPSTTYMNLMHDAIAAHLDAFLSGAADADATLEAIETGYREAAEQAGIL